MKNIILTEQMELGLEKRAAANRKKEIRRRARRDIESASRWWFSQMRRVVDRAVDWEPKQPARPSQGRLALG
jgi:hypothetical protein